MNFKGNNIEGGVCSSDDRSIIAIKIAYQCLINERPREYRAAQNHYRAYSSLALFISMK
jgi:hypothetical protein